MANALAISTKLKRTSVITDSEGKVITLPATIQKKAIQLSPESLRRKLEMEKKAIEEQRFVERQTDELKRIRSDVNASMVKYRESVYKNLSDIYSTYIEIEKSEHSDIFYSNLRGHLLGNDVKIQSNSTDVSLVIRYVFGSIKPKMVNDYGNVLLEAGLQEIKPEEFFEWVKNTTITNASAQYQQRTKIGENREELIKRARILILRMIDVFEAQPKASIEMPAWNAQKQVHAGSDLVFLIGRGVRRFDRGSDIADIRICFFIPPGIDFEFMVINRLAKHIYRGVHRWEEGLEKKQEEVWAGDLYNYLSEMEAEAAEKSRVQWQERMAAASDLDRGMA